MDQDLVSGTSTIRPLERKSCNTCYNSFSVASAQRRCDGAYQPSSRALQGELVQMTGDLVLGA